MENIWIFLRKHISNELTISIIMKTLHLLLNNFVSKFNSTSRLPRHIFEWQADIARDLPVQSQVNHETSHSRLNDVAQISRWIPRTVIESGKCQEKNDFLQDSQSTKVGVVVSEKLYSNMLEIRLRYRCVLSWFGVGTAVKNDTCLY